MPHSDARTADWHDHLHSCALCGDWYEGQQVRDRGEDPKRFPCVHMAYALTTTCRVHKDPADCPDRVLACVPKFDEYGFPVRDGGTGMLVIGFCPWCGKKLPPSKRDRYFSTLEKLGYGLADDLPKKFESDAWWRRQPRVSKAAKKRPRKPVLRNRTAGAGPTRRRVLGE
jgi:hypothetical protein